MDILKIGTMVYLVHRHWKKKMVTGPRVLTARIVGYQKIDGTIYPILQRGRTELDPLQNEIFTELEKAIKAIK